jgi:Mn-dependent DtxR family transcriptional regulator
MTRRPTSLHAQTLLLALFEGRSHTEELAAGLGWTRRHLEAVVTHLVRLGLSTRTPEGEVRLTMKGLAIATTLHSHYVSSAAAA